MLSRGNSPKAFTFNGTVVTEQLEVKGRLVYNFGREDRDLTEKPKTLCWNRAELINRTLRAQVKKEQNKSVISQRGGEMQKASNVSKYRSKTMSNVKPLCSTVFLSTYPHFSSYIKSCSCNNKLHEMGSRSPKNRTGIAWCQEKPQMSIILMSKAVAELRVWAEVAFLRSQHLPLLPFL